MTVEARMGELERLLAPKPATPPSSTVSVDWAAWFADDYLIPAALAQRAGIPLTPEEAAALALPPRPGEISPDITGWGQGDLWDEVVALLQLTLAGPLEAAWRRRGSSDARAPGELPWNAKTARLAALLHANGVHVNIPSPEEDMPDAYA